MKIRKVKEKEPSHIHDDSLSYKELIIDFISLFFEEYESGCLLATILSRDLSDFAVVSTKTCSAMTHSGLSFSMQEIKILSNVLLAFHIILLEGIDPIPLK